MARQPLFFISQRAAVQQLNTASRIKSQTVSVLPLLKEKRATWLNTYITSVRNGGNYSKEPFSYPGGDIFKHLSRRRQCGDACLSDISGLEEWTWLVEQGDHSNINYHFFSSFEQLVCSLYNKYKTIQIFYLQAKVLLLNVKTMPFRKIQSAHLPLLKSDWNTKQYLKLPSIQQTAAAAPEPRPHRWKIRCCWHVWKAVWLSTDQSLKTHS